MTVYKWYNSNELSEKLYQEGVSIPWSYDIVKDVNVDKTKKGWKEFGNLLKISALPAVGIASDRTGETSLSNMFVNDVWNGNAKIDDILSKWTKVSNDGISKYLSTHPDYDGSIRIIRDWDISR